MAAMRHILRIAAIMAGIAAPAVAAERDAVVLPAAVYDPAPDAAGLQTIVLAGGCFWGVQGVYEHVKGVQQAVSGYAGGEPSTAQYETVSTGKTGHAESVEVIFDPKQISYGEILRIFFSVAHDPTQLNRQGPDTGTQYRSAIFYSDAAQQKIAEAYIVQLQKTGAFHSKIVTRVDPLQGFYPAEAYHQDYLIRNPDQPYIVYNDLPKIANLHVLFAQDYRDQPVRFAPEPSERPGTPR
jgi:peptide-methionine (S)-S-oxide reductase